jgi:hypothetical protein
MAVNQRSGPTLRTKIWNKYDTVAIANSDVDIVWLRVLRHHARFPSGDAPEADIWIPAAGVRDLARYPPTSIRETGKIGEEGLR